jgi:hypothetical protein
MWERFVNPSCGVSIAKFLPSFTAGNIISEVTVSKDVPGFVSNALLMPFINEVTPYLILILYYVKHVFFLCQAIMCLEKVMIRRYQGTPY